MNRSNLEFISKTTPRNAIAPGLSSPQCERESPTWCSYSLVTPSSQLNRSACVFLGSPMAFLSAVNASSWDRRLSNRLGREFRISEQRRAERSAAPSRSSCSLDSLESDFSSGSSCEGRRRARTTRVESGDAAIFNAGRSRAECFRRSIFGLFLVSIPS